MPSMWAPSHTPFATVHALMQQSTSPPQNGRSSYSQRAVLGEEFDRPTPAEHVGIKAPFPQRVQRPRRGRPWLPGSAHLVTVEVEVQPERRRRLPIGHPGPAARAGVPPKPSVAIRARVASQTSPGSPNRSRSTCQRSAGSESRSQEWTESAIADDSRTPSNSAPATRSGPTTVVVRSASTRPCPHRCRRACGHR